MADRRDLRDELKQRLYPLLEGKGFRIDLRESPRSIAFRRRTPSSVQVLDVQFEKRGLPRFVVNFGTCGPAGTVCWDEAIAPEDVMPGQAVRNGRLRPRPGGGLRSWFCQDPPLLARMLGRPNRPAADVVSEVIALLPEVEAFFDSGAVGPHLFLLPTVGGIKDAS